jgi:hypothetical protein
LYKNKNRQQMYRRIFFITNAPGSGSQPDKVIYNGNETGLPFFFAIHTEYIRDSAIKGITGSNLVYISWQTATEINTSYFELQRSENGRDFQPIETFMAGGISKSISRYATTDLIYSVCYDQLYYRLKLVFINGKENFTDVITLDLKTVAAASVHDLTYNRNQQ